MRIIELFLHHCQFDKQLSPHTLAAYRQDIKQFYSVTNEHQVDKQKIRNYLEFLNKEGYAIKTIKRRMACLKSMYKWLEFEELIDKNPFHKINLKLKLPKQLPKNIAPPILTKLLDTAKKNLSLNSSSSYQAKQILPQITHRKRINKFNTLLAIELLFSTGIRVSELVNIQLDHIDFDKATIKIMGKGQRERNVFIIDQQIHELISTYLQARVITSPNHNFLITNTLGRPATTHLIRKLIKALATKARIQQHITPHMYRHSAACQYLESGLDMRYVQKLLGHQSISTTELYTHVNDQTLRTKITQANPRKQLLESNHNY